MRKYCEYVTLDRAITYAAVYFMQELGRIIIVIIEYEVPKEFHNLYVGQKVGHQALLLHLHHLWSKKWKQAVIVDTRFVSDFAIGRVLCHHRDSRTAHILTRIIRHKITRAPNDTKEASRSMHDYSPSALSVSARFRASQSTNSTKRLRPSLSSCSPYFNFTI